MASDATSRQSRLFHVLFIAVLPFLSGLAALIYELLWFRQLGLVFGNTVQAAATVMTAYMAGLALGAHIAGRRAPTLTRPARAFGLLELGIGLYALIVPALLALVRLVYCALYPHVSADSPWLTAIRLVLGLAALLLPTAFMGATLPLLARSVLPARRAFGRRLGILYGTNTAGAVTGTLLAGFILIPKVGLPRTNLVAVGVSLFVGITAIFASHQHTVAPTLTSLQPCTEPRPRLPLPLTAMALSGFLALAFEVTWFRTLVLIFGSTTYSFTVMLAVFLLGLSLGSLLLGWLCDRVPRPMTLFGALCAGIGFFTLVSLHLFTAVPVPFLAYLAGTGFRWRNIITAKAVIAAAFLLVPAIGFGGAFTAGARAVRDTVTASARAVGAASTVNTLGAALGAVSAGFLLLPLLGIENTLAALGRGVLALAALILIATPAARAGRWILGTLAILLLIAAAVVPAPGWDRQLLAAGPYFAPTNYTRPGAGGLKQKIASERLLYYAEGKTAVAAVTQGADEKLYFTMDGKVEADTAAHSMAIQRLMGHLPMLFHPAPRRVLNIGLGAGVTLGALNSYDVEHIEVVEIEPLVRECARIWGKFNHHVMADPRVQLTVNDARNHLLATREQYDVIASDPFEPVVAGAAGLYTVDHFSRARDRLRPHGLMSQFLPLYEMSENDFRMILRSFATVFPRCAVFFTGRDTVLLGARDELDLDMRRVAERLGNKRVASSLEEVGFAHAASILGALVVYSDEALGLVGPGRVNTDAHPVIEFSTPRSALHYTADTNQRALKRIFAPLPAAVLETLPGPARAQARNTRAALRLALDAGIARASNVPSGVAERLLEQAAAIMSGNPVVRSDLVAMKVALAFHDLAARRGDAAAVKFRQALAAEPTAFRPLYYLARHALEANDLESAGQYLFRALTAYPDSPVLLGVRARLRARRGDPAGACRDLENAIRQLPRHARFWADYAVCLTAAGRPQEAARAEQRAAALSAWLTRASWNLQPAPPLPPQE